MSNDAYNRKDNDGHRFLIPNELLSEFDDLFNRYCNTKFLSAEYYDLQAEFCNRFEQYMI